MKSISSKRIKSSKQSKTKKLAKSRTRSRNLGKKKQSSLTNVLKKAANAIVEKTSTLINGTGDGELISDTELTDVSQSSKNQNDEHPAMSFFYSDEKFVNSFEDDEIKNYISQSYPNFKLRQNDDAAIRRVVLIMLEDEDFIESLLAQYNINIYEFFKFLYRVNSALFKGSFIKRIQAVLKGKTYARIHIPEYRFRKYKR